MITGCVTAEIYKFIQGFNKIENFKNGFINLAIPIFNFSEPYPITKIVSKELDVEMNCPIKAIPEGFTIYDKILIEGPINFQ
jgi:ubiquitin-activating enzyme E1